MKRKRYILGILILGAMVIMLCMGSSGCDTGGQNKYQNEQSKITDKYAEALSAAVPYPLAKMKDSVERRNLVERLLRFNKPDKIGYVYVMSFGKFVGYYAVKGKVSATESQLTVTQQVIRKCWGDNCDSAVVDSMGDDGSFGANEGGDKGIFFFTTGGVMVETTLDWVYSDAPLNIDVPNLLAHK